MVIASLSLCVNSMGKVADVAEKQIQLTEQQRNTEKALQEAH